MMKSKVLVPLLIQAMLTCALSALIFGFLHDMWLFGIVAPLGFLYLPVLFLLDQLNLGSAHPAAQHMLIPFSIFFAGICAIILAGLGKLPVVLAQIALLAAMITSIVALLGLS